MRSLNTAVQYGDCVATSGFCMNHFTFLPFPASVIYFMFTYGCWPKHNVEVAVYIKRYHTLCLQIIFFIRHM